MKMNKTLDLGFHSIPNKFLTRQNQRTSVYPLSFGFNEEFNLGGIVDRLSGSLMYDGSYAYSASASEPTVQHMNDTSQILSNRYLFESVLEIGANDGCFIKNFPKEHTHSIEPCENFAKQLNADGYKTSCVGWSSNLADSLPKYDLVFSANCITHINDVLDAFEGLKIVLSDKGTIVLEEPWLYDVMRNTAYDQIYFEHPYIFCVLSVKKLCGAVGLYLNDVDYLPHVHGGSLRYIISHKNHESDRVQLIENLEIECGMNSYDAYKNFSDQVKKSKRDLVRCIGDISRDDKNFIIGYGATAKVATVLNYCGFTEEDIKFITDTTPAKQGKYIPLCRIPITPPIDLDQDFAVSHVFLGAWNFTSEILKKEKKFIARGGKFITHIPYVRTINASYYQ